MVMPIGAATFSAALRSGAEIFAALRTILLDEGHATGQGDEGGFAPSLGSNQAAVEVILRAIEKAGYRPGEDVAIALDPATTELVEAGSGVPGRRPDRLRGRPPARRRGLTDRPAPFGSHPAQPGPAHPRGGSSGPPPQSGHHGQTDDP
jgi:hypothetical protein